MVLHVLEAIEVTVIITVQQFKAGLVANPGVTFLSIRAKTVPDMRKKNNPYIGRVHKIVVANGSIGADYEKSTNTALLKIGEEATFEAGPHQWAEYYDRCLVKYPGKEKYYIRFIEKRRKEYWFLDDKPVNQGLFREFLPEKKSEIVKYRNFAVENILSIRWRKQLYTLVNG